MADEHSKDFDALRKEALDQGWFLTRDTLGDPSGGGVAYLCMRVHLLTSIRSHTIGAAALGSDAAASLDLGAVMVRNLLRAVAPDSQEIGVLKATKRMDGRMKREIKALRSCTHPSLVPILDCAPGDEPGWYVMKYFSQGDLDHRWDAYTGRVVEVLTRTREIAEALTVIHAKGLVHRDIKPANILLADNGRWVLTDFGIVFEEGATRHTQYGNPTPMSKDWRPEWVVSRYVEKFDPVVDIHSLARVARALIAGPGNNPPVSQLEEPEFDLRRLFPNVTHIGAVQQFFIDHITHKPGQSKSQAAQEFIGKLDELLALHHRRRTLQQVFSLFLTHSTSWISPSTAVQAQGLPVFLPPRVTRITGSIRFHNSGTRGATATVRLALRDISKQLVAVHEADVMNHDVDPSKSPGGWWDFAFTAPDELPSRVFLDVHIAGESLAITGIVLAAEVVS
jgi:hypothetical protein